MRSQTVHPCAHCGHPAPEGLRAHHECAMDAMSRQIAARAGGEIEKERREQRAQLDAAAIVGAREERAPIVALVRALRDEYRLTAQRSTEPGGQASVLVAATQRAAALGELLSQLEEESGEE